MRHRFVVVRDTLCFCRPWAIPRLLLLPCYHNTHSVHWRHCDGIKFPLWQIPLRLFILFPPCVTCNTSASRRHVFECCFPAPLFWNPIVSSPLYFASIPLIPGLFIIVFSPLHLDAHIYSMSMPPKFLPFTEVLGILTDKRPWYHVFSEASSWYTTIGLSVVAAGSALTWRGGTASVAADVSA